MLTEDKVTEIFFVADEFCKFFDRLTKKSTIEDPHSYLFPQSWGSNKAFQEEWKKE